MGARRRGADLGGGVLGEGDAERRTRIQQDAFMTVRNVSRLLEG